MKANLQCDDSGVLKITLSAQHEFETLLMDSLERNEKYEYSTNLIRDYDGFGGIKPVKIEIEFRLKKQ